DGVDAGKLGVTGSWDALHRAGIAPAAPVPGTPLPGLPRPGGAVRPRIGQTGGRGGAGGGAARMLAGGAASPPRRGLPRPGGAVRPRIGQTGGRGGAGGGATSMLAGVPPSPELLAKVEALPPANDMPGLDGDPARAADPHRSLRRLLRPFALALIIGLVLDGLDAVASVAMPALVRNGIDNGVQTRVFHAIIVVSVAALAIVLVDWAISAVQTM